MADYYEQSLSRPQMLPSRTTWRFAAHGGERQWTTFALTQARACEAVSETKPNNKRSKAAHPLYTISPETILLPLILKTGGTSLLYPNLGYCRMTWIISLAN